MENILSPVRQIRILSDACGQCFIKHDDEIDKIVGGNKIRKLQGVIKLIDSFGLKEIRTMGGVHSNHIAALSAITNMSNVVARAYVRDTWEKSTPTLDAARENQMEIEFISRTDYRKMRLDKPEPSIENGVLFVPEGGAGELANDGLKDLAKEIEFQFKDAGKTLIAIAAGTGSTAMGLIDNLSSKFSFFIHPAGKNFGLEEKFSKMYNSKMYSNIFFTPPSEQSEFGAWNSEAFSLVKKLKFIHKVQLDYVYTGPLIISLDKFLKRSNLKFGSILIYHSGGIQGNQAYEQKYMDKIQA